MEKKTVEKNEKKPYVKPRLRCVELATEEVLAKGCKLASSGANVSDDFTCGIGNGCVNTDS